MKATVDRDDLRRALLTTKRSVDIKKASPPVLRNVRIAAEDGDLTLEATDLEVSYRRALVGEAIDDGEALVPFKPLDTLIRKMDRGTMLDLVTEGDALRVRSPDGFTADLRTRELEDWPRLRVVSAKRYDVSGVIPYLRSLSECASDDEGRGPSLTMVHIADDAMFSSDKFRLLSVEISTGKEHGWVSADLARAVSMAKPDELHIASDAHCVLLADDQGNTWIYAKGDEELSPPPWRKIVPDGGEEGWVETASLAKATDRVTAVAATTNTPISLSRADDGSPAARAGSQDVGKATQVIEGSWPNVNIALNPRFLDEAPRALGEPETMRVSLQDGLKPALFEVSPDGLVEADPRVYYLVMPMRVS